MLTKTTQKTVVAGLFLALGIVLPFATAHAFGLQGNIFLPMHIPVLLCGYICGPLFGAVLGLLLPLCNSLLTGMPAIFPTALLMTFELLTYGFMSGLLYKKLPIKKMYAKTCTSLIISILSGRIVYGIIGAVLLVYDSGLEGVSAIAATISGIPGIIIQLIFIPIIIFSLEKFIKKN